MKEHDSPAIEVREGDPEGDLQAIIALNATVQDLHVAAEPSVFRPSDDLPDIEAFHLGFMREEKHRTLVAESGGRVVGYVSLEVERREPNTFSWSRERLYVHQIGVHPDYRRLGVGRVLMERAAALAVELGMGEVALDTWIFNTGARRFFESLGYAVYNVRMRKTVAE